MRLVVQAGVRDGSRKGERKGGGGERERERECAGHAECNMSCSQTLRQKVMSVNEVIRRDDDIQAWLMVRWTSSRQITHTTPT